MTNTNLPTSPELEAWLEAKHSPAWEYTPPVPAKSRKLPKLTQKRFDALMAYKHTPTENYQINGALNSIRRNYSNWGNFDIEAAWGIAP